MKILNRFSISTLAVSLVLVFAGPIVALAGGGATVNLGASGNYVILAKTGISTTGVTKITGDIGVSPIAATAITGFGLVLDSSGTFSQSSLVVGKAFASDYTNPTPANLTTAVLNMQTAYTDAAGRAANVTELGAGNIGGLTIAPGVYKWGTGVTIPTNVTLSGGTNDIWIFQIAQALTVNSGVKVNLSGGAQASNIFWVVGGQTTIGTGAMFNGNILDQTAIVITTGATLNGRALAQTAVTLDSNAVTIPIPLIGNGMPAPVPIIQVSCDPLPVGMTAIVINNVCVYTPITVSTTPPSTHHSDSTQNSNSVFTSNGSQASAVRPSVSELTDQVRSLIRQIISVCQSKIAQIQAVGTGTAGGGY